MPKYKKVLDNHFEDDTIGNVGYWLEKSML